MSEERGRTEAARLGSRRIRRHRAVCSPLHVFTFVFALSEGYSRYSRSVAKSEADKRAAHAVLATKWPLSTA